jgi:hypothetical protein
MHTLHDMQHISQHVLQRWQELPQLCLHASCIVHIGHRWARQPLSLQVRQWLISVCLLYEWYLLRLAHTHGLGNT